MLSINLVVMLMQSQPGQEISAKAAEGEVGEVTLSLWSSDGAPTVCS